MMAFYVGVFSKVRGLITRISMSEHAVCGESCVVGATHG